MLSIAQSRYTIPVQFTFLVLNSVAVLLITIYNADTPDLYPNNAHHKMGWLLTWVFGAQVLMGLINAYAGYNKDTENLAYNAITYEAMEEHDRLQNQRPSLAYPFSNDSGQGTEPNTESLRSHSFSSNYSNDILEINEELPVETEEKSSLMQGGKFDKYLAKKIPGLDSSKLLRVFHLLYMAIDRVILILGFVALSTGIVTLGGFFVSFLSASIDLRISLTGIARHISIQRTSPFHQGRGLLLVRCLDSWTMGWLFRRHRLGVEYQPLEEN